MTLREGSAAPSTRRFLLAWVAPPTLLLLAALAPVILGRDSFFLRDVFSVHLEMRGALAEQLAAGAPAPPQVDPYRGGGQALAGNPNAVSFHPTAWLHAAPLQRWLPLLPAFNVHLWLHLVFAPFAFFWLARQLGLGRRGAWAAAVVWGFSGFLLSQLAFYNLIAGVVTAPALAAAAVATVRRTRTGLAVAALGVLTALVLVSGDPMTAVAALVAALGLAAAEAWNPPPREEAGDDDGGAVDRRRWLPLLWLAAAVACGVLLALPQIVELLRILPGSARGAGWGAAMRTAGSFDPRQVAEQLLPFAFGRPDLLADGTFWGYRFHQGSWPFYFTLYPGLAVWALLAASGRSWRLSGDPHQRLLGRVGRRAWALVAGGLFFALGAFNPAVSALLSLPGLDAARYPLKLWLWVAMGTALLAGVGFERLSGGGAGVSDTGVSDTGASDAVRRTAARALLTLGVLAALFAALWGVLRLAPRAAAGVLLGCMPAGSPPWLAASEVGRWAGLAAVSAAAAVLLALAVVLALRRPGLGGPLLLTLHAALQLALLRPALVTEPVAPYAAPPPILAALPAAETVVHGSAGDLFGADPPSAGELPADEVRWIFRRTFAEAYPFAGALWGRRYELYPSPEGLDQAALEEAAAAVRRAPDDAARLRLLAAWGVGRLILGRPLDQTVAPGASPAAEQVYAAPSFGRPIRVYRLPRAAPAVYLAAGRVHLRPGAPGGAAAAVLADRRFRPGVDVVLESAAAPPAADPAAPPPRLRVAAAAGRLSTETEASRATVLVWQRARLPLHRAAVDGTAVPVRTVNLFRVGVEVPAGRHRVEVWVERSPLARAALAALAGAVALLLLAWAAATRRRRAKITPPGGGARLPRIPLEQATKR